jgi:hypothetical protein
MLRMPHVDPLCCVRQVVYLGPEHETRMDDPKIVWRSTAHVRARQGGLIPNDREQAATAKFQTDQELMKKMQKVRLA